MDLNYKQQHILKKKILYYKNKWEWSVNFTGTIISSFVISTTLFSKIFISGVLIKSDFLRPFEKKIG